MQGCVRGRHRESRSVGDVCPGFPESVANARTSRQDHADWHPQLCHFSGTTRSKPSVWPSHTPEAATCVIVTRCCPCVVVGSSRDCCASQAYGFGIEEDYIEVGRSRSAPARRRRRHRRCCRCDAAATAELTQLMCPVAGTAGEAALFGGRLGRRCVPVAVGA